MIKNYLKFVGIFAVILLLSSCKKEDISGKLDGIWRTQWEDILKGDVDEIKIDEAIEFISDNSTGSRGSFRQIFEGEATFDDWENESVVSFNVFVSGTWRVKNKNVIELRYDLNDMAVNIGKSNVEADYTDAGIALLFGDWSGALSSALKAGDTSKINKSIEKEVNHQINVFFKDMFHKINKDKKGMTDVEIDGDMMTCDVNHGFFGREQTYDKVRQSNTSTSRPAQSNNYYSSDYDGDDDETFGDLDDYDWLTERYVTPDDLDWRSKDGLRIMRNWIFARHGYRFKSEDLQEYFSQYPWYTPMYNDVNHQLSEIENYNIDMIKKYEKRFK